MLARIVDGIHLGSPKAICYNNSEQRCSLPAVRYDPPGKSFGVQIMINNLLTDHSYPLAPKIFSGMTEQAAVDATQP